jgi:hypothetical protein
MNDIQKKEALQKIREARASKRNAEFAKGQADLRSSQSNVFDKSLSQNDKMEVVSPEFREAKVDAYRKARRQSLGKPIEEAVGETLDYKAMKKEMMNRGKSNVGDSLRRGIKPLAKGLKAIPIIGTLAALAGSEDASAAIPGLDSAESAGMSGADENMMMAEIQGRKDYDESQAAEDAKKNKLAVLAKLAELKGNE